MAEKTVAGTKIPEHPLLATLLGEGAGNTKSFLGYIGPTKEGRVRLYLNLNDLSESVEIQSDDIIHFTTAPESIMPYGGTVVWVKKSAEITYHRVEEVGDEPKADLGEVRKGRLRIKMRSQPKSDSCVSHPCSSRCRPCSSRCMACRSSCRGQ